MARPEGKQQLSQTDVPPMSIFEPEHCRVLGEFHDGDRAIANCWPVATDSGGSGLSFSPRRRWWRLTLSKWVAGVLARKRASRSALPNNTVHMNKCSFS